MAEVVKDVRGDRTGYDLGEPRLVELINENICRSKFWNNHIIATFTADLVERVKEKNGYTTSTDFFLDGRLVASMTGESSYVMRDMK